MEQPIVKFYEEDDDLMPKLRPLVLPKNIFLPFNKLLEKKWCKTLNDKGHVKAANEFLEAFLSAPNSSVVMFYIADLFHKLGLSVSYEMFKQETGYDLFEVSLRQQIEEQMMYMCRPGYLETDPQVIYKLNDFVNGQSFYNKNPEMCYDRDVVNEIWDDLRLWPSIDCKRPTRRGRKEYEEFLLNVSNLQMCQPRKRNTNRRNSFALEHSRR